MSTAEEIQTATHDELLAGMTASEREALAAPYPADDDDDADQPATNKIEVNDDDKGATNPAGDGAGNDPAADAAAAAAAAVEQAGKEPGQPAAAAVATEPSPAPSAPLFVAEAPADADIKLADISAQKKDLHKQHDEGDITTDEMLAKLDVLGKEEREIERAVDRAQIAASMETQRQKNQWDTDCNTFLVAKPEYKDPELMAHLNETVIAFAKMPRNAGISGPALLEKAHNAVMNERGTPVTAAPAAAPAAKQVKAPPQTVPPSLHTMPAAQQADAGSDRFAGLNKLNGFELEKALGKMSAEERDAFMAAE